MDELQWLQSLQSFLDQLLKAILPEDVDRYQFLTPEAMNIWGQAFTHETVSSTHNYEDLEYIGDAALKFAFPQYLALKFPHLHKGEYTELNVAYMSKMKNAELAQKMGFGPYIRVIGMDRAILNLEADVFESFFGALNNIANSIQFGSGFVYCYNMMAYLFEDVYIDESLGRGSAKTQVLQMFVRFDLQKPQEIVSGLTVNIQTTGKMAVRPYEVIGKSKGSSKKEAEYQAYKMAINTLVNRGSLIVQEQQAHIQNDIEFSIELLPEHIDFLKSYGVVINDPIIGTAIAKTKKEAEYLAYTQALETLKYYGITTEWAEQAKKLRDFSDPVVAQYVPAVSNKLETEGFVDMAFFIPRKTTTTKGAIVELIGIRENGERKLLTWVQATERENSYQNAKANVLKQYIKTPPTNR
jgi:dsRNA-specific ribonuclease